MPISEFHLSVNRTINLGNYENLKIEASVKVSLAEGDDHATLRKEARAELRSLLEDAYRCGRSKKNPAEETES